MSISFTFFDVANTLLKKPEVGETIQRVLEKHRIFVPLDQIKFAHHIATEMVVFPDRTSRDFYGQFNRSFLRALGVLPNDALVDDIFTALRGQTWVPFDDVHALADWPTPMGILSNWDTSLETTILASIEVSKFHPIIGSQSSRVAKPDPLFFQQGLDAVGLPASQVLMVGDSIRLDIEPALKLGLHTVLIDRENRMPWYNGRRTSSLTDLRQEILGAVK